MLSHVAVECIISSNTKEDILCCISLKMYETIPSFKMHYVQLHKAEGTLGNCSLTSRVFTEAICADKTVTCLHFNK